MAESAANIVLTTSHHSELEVKKLKDRKVDREILPAICALLNHYDGGKLVLTSKVGTEFQSQISVSSFVRSLEQKVKEMFGLRAMSRFSLYSKTLLQLVFNVSSGPVFRCCSLTSNLYLPSEVKVLRVSPVADPEVIHDILIRTYKPSGNLPQPNPENWTFVKGQSLPSLRECKQVEFKSLKSEKERHTSLVDRIFNNDFASYVSAFANDCGGRIFYGINDYGVVEGQIFDFKTKLTPEELTKKVAEEITCRMIWPKKCGQPEKGKHWDIHFEEVFDGDGRVVPSTFVIIISVAACPGGVFTRRPESYVVVEGNVQRMGFEEWKERFIKSRVSVLESSALIEYSAFNLSDDTRLVAQRLTKLRQTGEMTAFRMLAQSYLNKAEELCSIVRSEQAAYAAAEISHVEKAKGPNSESSKPFYEGQVPDSMVLEVKQPNSSPQIPSQQISVTCKRNWHASDENAFPQIGRAGFHNFSNGCNGLD